jgi:alkyl sulfatase BDS1-like metallo-beta-lactamase superfamily hydrolase
VLERARSCFAEGDYRWVAQVVNHVVFADPDNMEARALQADALEQLGYQAESGPWRSFYLTGAQELRHGAPPIAVPSTTQPDVASAMTIEMILQYLGVRLDGPRAGDRSLGITLEVTDGAEDGGAVMFSVGLRHGALHHTRGRPHPTPDVTVRTPKAALVAAMAAGRLDQLVGADGVDLDGRAEVLGELSDLLDTFELFFPIVTP